MIQVEGVSFRYSHHLALDRISFSVPKGSIAALVGPNGAGKTTLMRCLAGLHAPWEGGIQVDGIDVIAHPRKAHRSLGFLQDFFGVWQEMTVAQSVAHYARAQRVPESEVQRRVGATLELLGIAAKSDALASQLSRGQRQRLAIAQAVVHRPRLLILDEPASGLDPEARIELASTFRRLRDEGMTLLVSSHILAELDQYADRMLVIQEGRLLESGPLQREESALPVRDLEFLLDGDAPGVVADLPTRQGVEQVSKKDGWTQIRFRGGRAEQAALLAWMVERKAPVVEFRSREETLQDRYIQMVRRDA